MAKVNTNNAAYLAFLPTNYDSYMALLLLIPSALFLRRPAPSLIRVFMSSFLSSFVVVLVHVFVQFLCKRTHLLQPLVALGLGVELAECATILYCL